MCVVRFSYSLKQVGYIVCGMFLSENDELLRLVINTVRSDLLSRNESFQCLALEFTANGKLMHPIFHSRIFKLM